MNTGNENDCRNWVYGYEIQWRPGKLPKQEETIRILYRFKTIEERRKWFREGNRVPLNHPTLINERRNPIIYYHPMVKLSMKSKKWPQIFTWESDRIQRYRGRAFE